MKILDKLAQVLSVLYYIAMVSIPVVLYFYSLQLVAYAFFLVIANMMVLQFKLAKLSRTNQNIVGNQVSLTEGVNAMNQGRNIRLKIKKQRSFNTGPKNK